MPYGDKTGKKYEHLLEDPNFRRFHSNVSKGSVILGDVYVKAIGRFSEWAKMSPSEFASLSPARYETRLQRPMIAFCDSKTESRDFLAVQKMSIIII